MLKDIFENLVKFYNHFKGLLNQGLFLIYGLAFLYSYTKISIWLSLIIFYIPTIIYLYLFYKSLLTLTKQWIKLLLTGGILFFFLNILTKKILNTQFGIEPDYLNYSANIYAALMLLPIGVIIVFIYQILKWTVISIWYGLTNFFTNKYREKSQELTFIFKPMILMGLAIAVFPIISVIESLQPYYLIADAYPISSCGKPIKNALYIQKNDKECYLISQPFSQNISIKNINLFNN